MLVFGFAEVNVHINTAVSPSRSLYGLGELDLTSGLSVQMFKERVKYVK